MRILFWFRKDLRLDDNTGLHQAALDARGEVVPFYASEPALLSRPDMAATRVRFVLDSLAELVLARGGEVIPVPAAALPSASGLAAELH